MTGTQIDKLRRDQERADALWLNRVQYGLVAGVIALALPVMAWIAT